jgi:hypothetical protein
LLILLSRLSVGLLLGSLLPSFVLQAKAPSESAHGGASRSTFSRLARYRTGGRTKRCASCSSFQHVSLRGAVLLIAEEFDVFA